MIELNGQSLSVTIDHAGHAELDSAWRGETCREEYARVYFILDGEADIIIDGQHHKLCANHYYLIPPRSDLHYYCNSRFEVIWFHAAFKLFAGLDIFDITDSRLELPAEDRNAIRKQFLTVVEKSRSPEFGEQLLARGVAIQLVTQFLVPRKTPDRDYSAILPALEYIERNFRSTILLRQLAQECGYEQTYFSSLFKRATGETPIQFVHRRRINEARGMLTQTDHKLETIASELGYTDAFHFSKTFKKVAGVSPSRYRRQALTPVP